MAAGATLQADELKGGATVEESATIFIRILEGNGTKAQEAAVIANAGMALFCSNQSAGLEVAIAKASEALVSGKALECFKRLIEKS